MFDDTSDEELPLPRPSKAHINYTAPPRKRSRGSYASNASSDPPYFSSDDLAEASLDNYTSPRRKKLYRRAWYEDEGAGVPMRHNALKRASKKAKDSGVFMSSDSNSTTSEEGFSLEPIKAKLKQNVGRKMDPIGTPPVPPFKRPLPHPDRLAQEVIAKCLETDNEVVDLSNCALASISSETLRPLRNLIRRPKAHTMETEEAYQSLTPALKLFLASNMLDHVPGELVNLEYLTVLSLRNNRLESLPQSLGKLKNLVELNVGGNRLRYLPFELLQLIQKSPILHNLHLRPNPLFRPLPPKSGSWRFSRSLFNTEDNIIGHGLAEEYRVPPDFDVDDPFDEELRQSLITIEVNFKERRVGSALFGGPCVGVHEPIYIGSSLIVYFDSVGTALIPSQMPPLRVDADTQILPRAANPTQNRPQLPETASDSSAPSLFELALRTASEHLTPSDVARYFPADVTPESVLRGLQTGLAAVEEGVRCSVCSRNYVIPRAEWVEYWHCSKDDAEQWSYDEICLPFLRKSCSWACADRVFEDYRWRPPLRGTDEEVTLV